MVFVGCVLDRVKMKVGWKYMENQALKLSEFCFNRQYSKGVGGIGQGWVLKRSTTDLWPFQAQKVRRSRAGITREEWQLLKQWRSGCKRCLMPYHWSLLEFTWIVCDFVSTYSFSLFPKTAAANSSYDLPSDLVDSQKRRTCLAIPSYHTSTRRTSPREDESQRSWAVAAASPKAILWHRPCAWGGHLLKSLGSQLLPLYGPILHPKFFEKHFAYQWQFNICFDCKRLLDCILYMYMVCFMCCLFVRCFRFEFGLLCLKWKGQISDSAWKISILGDAFQVSCRVSGDGLISFDLPFLLCWSPRSCRRNQHHISTSGGGERECVRFDFSEMEIYGAPEKTENLFVRPEVRAAMKEQIMPGWGGADEEDQ